eukprot:COSAG01_NODE_2146_length_8303_cov_24.698684_7_plen_565_part_00
MTGHAVAEATRQESARRAALAQLAVVQRELSTERQRHAAAEAMSMALLANAERELAQQREQRQAHEHEVGAEGTVETAPEEHGLDPPPLDERERQRLASPAVQEAGATHAPHPLPCVQAALSIPCETHGRCVWVAAAAVAGAVGARQQAAADSARARRRAKRQSRDMGEDHPSPLLEARADAEQQPSGLDSSDGGVELSSMMEELNSLSIPSGDGPRGETTNTVAVQDAIEQRREEWNQVEPPEETTDGREDNQLHAAVLCHDNGALRHGLVGMPQSSDIPSEALEMSVEDEEKSYFEEDDFEDDDSEEDSMAAAIDAGQIDHDGQHESVRQEKGEEGQQVEGEKDETSTSTAADPASAIGTTWARKQEQEQEETVGDCAGEWSMPLAGRAADSASHDQQIKEASMSPALELAGVVEQEGRGGADWLSSLTSALDRVEMAAAGDVNADGDDIADDSNGGTAGEAVQGQALDDSNSSGDSFDSSAESLASSVGEKPLVCRSSASHIRHFERDYFPHLAAVMPFRVLQTLPTHCAERCLAMGGSDTSSEPALRTKPRAWQQQQQQQ